MKYYLCEYYHCYNYFPTTSYLLFFLNLIVKWSDSDLRIKIAHKEILFYLMISYSNIFQFDSCLSELHQKKLIVRSNTPHKHGCLLSIYFDNYTDTNFRMEKENLLFINNLLKRCNFRRLSTFTTTNRLYSDHKYSYLFLFTVILPLILSFRFT